MFKFIVTSLLVFVLLLSLNGSRVWAEQGPPSNSKISLVERGEKITEYRLANGLRLLLVPDRSTPVVTVMVVYHVGSRNEGVGYTGSTHLLEHMMFKGTPTFNKEKGTQIAAMLESIGADYNASTLYDRTNYFETLPSDRLELALQIEADRMRNSLIRDSDRQSEMTVVRNELERGENEPSTVLDLQVYATAYREHPYHHPTIGWRSDVEGVPTARLKAFYDTFYWPSNATLTLIGDFSEADALALTEKYFGPIPASPAPIPPMYTVEPKQQGERRFLLHRAGELPIIEMAWHTTNGRDQDVYPLVLLGTILTQGVTSRLYQALVEKQLAVNILANADRLYDPGLFEIAVTVRPGVKLEAVEQVVRAEIEQLKNNLITPEELNRAKTLIAAEFAYQNDGPAGVAAQLAEAISNGDWHIYTNFRKNIEAANAEQVQAVVKKYFYSDNLTVGYFEPTESEGQSGGTQQAGIRGQAPGARDQGEPHSAFYKLATGTRRLAPDSTLAPDPWSLTPGQAVPFAERIQRAKMANGAALLTIERHTTPTVAISGTLLAGDYLDPKEKPYLAYMVAEMLDKGTAHQNKLQLASELENIGASLNFQTGTFTLSFNGRCLSKDVERVLGLLAEELRQPSFPAEELEKLKTQVVAQLRQELDDTYERAYERLTQLLFDPANPLYRKPVETRIKSVESITVKDLEQFYKSHYGGASLILSVVGDIDQKTIARLASRQFENWSGGNSKRLQVAETALQKGGQHDMIAMKDKANADIFIGHAGGLRRSSPDYYAAMLANNALGQSTLSSRLGLQVRDTEGLTYGIISRFFDTGLVDGPWAISVSANPENIDRAVEASLKVLREYVKNGINEKELEESKGSLIGAFKVGLSTNPGLAAHLVEIELYNLGLDYLDRYPQLVGSITKTQVDEAIRHHFHPDQVTVVVAGEVGNKAERNK